MPPNLLSILSTILIQSFLHFPKEEENINVLGIKWGIGNFLNNVVFNGQKMSTA